jgi:hypothetical protein
MTIILKIPLIKIKTIKKLGILKINFKIIIKMSNNLIINLINSINKL